MSHVQKNVKHCAIWIAWERHRRTIELCRYFKIKALLFSSKLPRIIKHPYFTIKTIVLILKIRPIILIVQNPSVILTLLVCIMHKIFHYELIVDAHNAGLGETPTKIRHSNAMYRYFQREADTTIVTNSELERIVNSNGGNAFVLPDKLPDPPKLGRKLLKTKYNAVFICTYSNDEPYRDVIEAARLLPKNITVYITGNSKKLDQAITDKIPDNVILTGFIDEIAYWRLLSSVDIVIALTTRDNCLLCGAYEGVSIGKPLLLSDKKALRLYFHKGCVYTINSSSEIAKNILYAINNNYYLQLDILALKHDLDSTWKIKANLLKQYLHLA